jgi:hypothetical protein
VGRIDKAAARGRDASKSSMAIGTAPQGRPNNVAATYSPDTPDDGSQAACFDPPCESETTSSPLRASVI